MKKIREKYKDLPIPIKAGLWFMICSILQSGLSIITVPIFTRILDVKEYGLYSTYVSWESIIIILITLRLDYTIFNKGMSKYKDNRNGYVASMQIITTITTIFIMLLYFIFRFIINNITELSTGIMILMIIQAGLYPALNFWIIKNRYEYNYKLFVIISLGLVIINTIVGIICVLLINGNNGIIRIVSYAIVNILFSLVLYCINFKNGLHNYKLEHIKYAILFNIPMIPHYLSTYILNQSDRIMIQKMTNKSNVGIYNVSYNAGMIMTIVSTSVINALTPWYYQKFDENKIKDVSCLFLPLTICITLPIFVFILFAPEALKILATKSYYESIYIIPPVSASIIFIFMYSFFSTAEFYYDKNKFSILISSIAAIINIIMNFIFIKLFDYRAAGYTTLISYFILSTGHFVYANKIIKKNNNNYFVNYKEYFLISLIIFIYIIFSCFLYNYTMLRYLIALIIIFVLIKNRKKIINIFKEIKVKKKRC